MRLPIVIEKLAYSVSQHRKVVNALSAPVRGGSSTFFHNYDRVMVDKNGPTPVYEMIHELGHKADIALSKDGDLYYGNIPRIIAGRYKPKRYGMAVNVASDGIPEYGGKYNIMQEIGANRMGARILLNTGSPISEVKDYIRKVTPHMDSYKIVDMANKMNKHRVFDGTIDRITEKSNGALLGYKRGGSMSSKEYESTMRKAVLKLKHYAKMKNFNAPLSVGQESKTPVDISYLPIDIQKSIKEKERETMRDIFVGNINKKKPLMVGTIPPEQT